VRLAQAIFHRANSKPIVMLNDKQKRSAGRSAEAQNHRPWYNLAIWRGDGGLRNKQLDHEPLCERCRALGIVTPATVVNHRRPHRGDWSLFIDPANHESVCKDHHDGLIQREEARGHVIGTDIDGRPVDPDHPWNWGR
jgi:5-methylcytosine-specific restriction protein A